MVVPIDMCGFAPIANVELVQLGLDARGQASLEGARGMVGEDVPVVASKPRSDTLQSLADGSRRSGICERRIQVEVESRR